MNRDGQKHFKWAEIFLVLAPLVALPSWNCADPPLQPNVVLVVADDLGWGDVGYNGSEISTPEIDSLTKEGTKLNHFYTHPVCSPTRAALFTGRSPLKTGMLRPFEPWFETGLPLNEKLMPEYFRDAGYQTFAVGKWHLGPNKKEYYPNNRGFDHFYGHLGGFLNYYTHTLWSRIDWQRNGQTVEEAGYTTHLITSEAVRLIRSRDQSKPMFLYIAFNAPHSPLQAPSEAIEKYSHIEDDNRRIYAAMVSEMDHGIGQIRSTLSEERISENTLLCFMSDNGGSERLGADNGPLRGGKGSPWEGGVRVPAVLSWPARVPASKTVDDTIVVEDLLPTLLAAVGIEAQFENPIDGRNVWPSLTLGEPLDHEPFLLGSYDLRGNFRFAYFENDWKLVHTTDPQTQSPINQLFRVGEDESETIDLSEIEPDVSQRMLETVGSLRETQAPVPMGPPPTVLVDPGGPGAALPDNAPPTGESYADSAWQSGP